MNLTATLRLSVVLLVLGAICSPAYAIDVVTRKSATNRLSGTITAVNKSEITLKPATGADVVIPINDIEYIQWDAAPPQLRAGIGQEDAGSLEAAITTYQGVLDQLPATAGYVRADVQFYIARALAKLALADSSRLPDAITRMKAFTDGNIDSLRYYEAMDYLGRLYLANKDYLNAEAAFTSIERSPLEDLQLSAKSSKARVLQAQGQIDQALQAYDAVLKLPAKDNASKQRQLEAMLGKATCLNLKNQFDDSLKLLTDVVAKASEDDARLQAEAQLQRGNALMGQSKNQEAMMAFLLVDILFSGQQEYHAEALYQLTKLWPTVGQPGRAEEARATLESKYPNSPWTKKLSGS